MRIVFKILLAPVWLVLVLLKWASLIATGIASIVLRLGGMMLLLIGMAYLLLHFEPILPIRVFAVGIGAFIAPYIASISHYGCTGGRPNPDRGAHSRMKMEETERVS